jgi:hypothetical protein
MNQCKKHYYCYFEDSTCPGCQVEKRREKQNQKGRRDMNVLIDRINRNYFLNSRFSEINQMLDVMGEPRYEWSEFHQLDFEEIERILDEIREKFDLYLKSK